MEHVFLTRRNLLTLLSKLDRQKEGDITACTIMKCDNQHKVYPQTMRAILVTALEDEEYYTERQPGAMHPKDDPDARSSKTQH